MAPCRLAVLLAVVVAGCAADDRTCNRSDRTGCLCLPAREWTTRAEGVSCTAAIAGGTTCCEDTADDVCWCPRAARCIDDGTACRCTPLHEDLTGTEVETCAPPDGGACCLVPGEPGAAGSCRCGATPCSIGATEVPSCTAEVVVACDPAELPVPSCSPRSP